MEDFNHKPISTDELLRVFLLNDKTSQELQDSHGQIESEQGATHDGVLSETEKQKRFEESTRKGFEKFRFIMESKSEEDGYIQSLLTGVESLTVHNEYPEAGEVLLFLYSLFNRFDQMNEMIKRKRGSGSEFPSSLLKDMNLNVLEFAGMRGSLSDTPWPLMNTWINSGVKDVYLTDINIGEIRDSHYSIADTHIRELDVLKPSKTLDDKVFDFIYSAGFFGHPTHAIANNIGKDLRKMEHEVIDNLKGSLRSGGFFVFGTREFFSFDLSKLESEGFEILKCRLYNDYVILRKK
ncbi:MAG: hypothetical protein WCO30_02095 [bacterium]